MSILVALLLAFGATAGAPEDEAARAEAAAFELVEARRWCDATHEFMRANALAPADVLVFNAALAAERAGDVARARALFTLVPDTSPKGAAARRHLDDLAGAGPTDACPAPVPPESEAASSPTETPEPSASKLAFPTASEASATATSTANETSATPATASGEARAADSRTEGAASDSLLPLGVGGAGALLALGGGVAIALGGASFFAHEDARAAIAAAEVDGADPATLVDEHARQRDARAAWEGGGQGAVVAGTVAVVAGVATAAAAAALLLFGVE